MRGILFPTYIFYEGGLDTCRTIVDAVQPAAAAKTLPGPSDRAGLNHALFQVPLLRTCAAPRRVLLVGAPQPRRRQDGGGQVRRVLGSPCIRPARKRWGMSPCMLITAETASHSRGPVLPSGVPGGRMSLPDSCNANMIPAAQARA